MIEVIQYNELLGSTVIATHVEKGDGDVILLDLKDGRTVKLYHQSDCCESVSIEDITGDLLDLVGEPLIMAEMVTNNELPDKEEGSESYTWSFQKFGTIKGTVTIRWYGESNGYYSETADMSIIDNT